MAFGDFIQVASATGASGVATTPTLSVGATAGNLLIAVLARSGSGGTFPSVSGFTSISGVNSGNIAAEWWYNEAAGGETTVSLSGEATTTGNWRFVLAEFEGPFPASLLDVGVANESEANISTVVTSQPSGTSGTTSQADALAVAVFTADSGSNVDGSRTYNSSFTERVFESTTASPARASVALATRVLTATGTYSCTFSCTDTGDEMYGAIAVFLKETAAGGGRPNYSMLLGVR